MINAYWEELEFKVQEGTAQEWKRIVDTALPSPDDFLDDGIPLERTKYLLAPDRLWSYVDPRKATRGKTHEHAIEDYLASMAINKMPIVWPVRSP